VATPPACVTTPATAVARNPPGGRVTNSGFNQRLEDMLDALDDYVLVVGINAPSLR